MGESPSDPSQSGVSQGTTEAEGKEGGCWSTHRDTHHKEPQLLQHKMSNPSFLEQDPHGCSTSGDFQEAFPDGGRSFGTESRTEGNIAEPSAASYLTAWGNALEMHGLKSK